MAKQYIDPTTRYPEEQAMLSQIFSSLYASPYATQTAPASSSGQFGNFFKGIAEGLYTDFEGIADFAQMIGLDNRFAGSGDTFSNWLGKTAYNRPSDFGAADFFGMTDRSGEYWKSGTGVRDIGSGIGSMLGYLFPGLWAEKLAAKAIGTAGKLGTIGRSIVSGTTMAGLESAGEAGSTYMDLTHEGMDPTQANQKGWDVFGKNMALLTGTNIPEMAIAYAGPGGKVLGKLMQNNTARRTGKAFADGAIETFQEKNQQSFQAEAMGRPYSDVFSAPWNWTPEEQFAGILGGITGGPMAVGVDVAQNYANKLQEKATAQQLSDAEVQAVIQNIMDASAKSKLPPVTGPAVAPPSSTQVVDASSGGGTEQVTPVGEIGAGEKLKLQQEHTPMGAEGSVVLRTDKEHIKKGLEARQLAAGEDYNLLAIQNEAAQKAIDTGEPQQIVLARGNSFKIVPYSAKNRNAIHEGWFGVQPTKQEAVTVTEQNAESPVQQQSLQPQASIQPVAKSEQKTNTERIAEIKEEIKQKEEFLVMGKGIGAGTEGIKKRLKELKEEIALLESGQASQSGEQPPAQNVTVNKYEKPLNDKKEQVKRLQQEVNDPNQDSRSMKQKRLALTVAMKEQEDLEKKFNNTQKYIDNKSTGVGSKRTFSGGAGLVPSNPLNQSGVRSITGKVDKTIKEKTNTHIPVATNKQAIYKSENNEGYEVHYPTKQGHLDIKDRKYGYHKRVTFELNLGKEPNIDEAISKIHNIYGADSDISFERNKISKNVIAVVSTVDKKTVDAGIDKPKIIGELRTGSAGLAPEKASIRSVEYRTNETAPKTVVSRYNKKVNPYSLSKLEKEEQERVEKRKNVVARDVDTPIFNKANEGINETGEIPNHAGLAKSIKGSIPEQSSLTIGNTTFYRNPSDVLYVLHNKDGVVTVWQYGTASAQTGKNRNTSMRFTGQETRLVKPETNKFIKQENIIGLEKNDKGSWQKIVKQGETAGNSSFDIALMEKRIKDEYGQPLTGVAASGYDKPAHVVIPKAINFLNKILPLLKIVQISTKHKDMIHEIRTGLENRLSKMAGKDVSIKLNEFSTRIDNINYEALPVIIDGNEGFHLRVKKTSKATYYAIYDKNANLIVEDTSFGKMFDKDVVKNIFNVQEKSPKEKNIITSFKTSQGSTYSIDINGRTSRTKNSEGEGKGTTYPHLPVLYVTPENAKKIIADINSKKNTSLRLGHVLNGKFYNDANYVNIFSDFMGLPEGATYVVATVDKDTNKPINVYQAFPKPEIGLNPIEKAYSYTGNGETITHIGNTIVDVTYSSKNEGIKKQNEELQQALDQYKKSKEEKDKFSFIRRTIEFINNWAIKDIRIQEVEERLKKDGNIIILTFEKGNIKRNARLNSEEEKKLLSEGYTPMRFTYFPQPIPHVHRYPGNLTNIALKNIEAYLIKLYDHPIDGGFWFRTPGLIEVTWDKDIKTGENIATVIFYDKRDNIEEQLTPGQFALLKQGKAEIVNGRLIFHENALKNEQSSLKETKILPNIEGVWSKGEQIVKEFEDLSTPIVALSPTETIINKINEIVASAEEKVNAAGSVVKFLSEAQLEETNALMNQLRSVIRENNSKISYAKQIQNAVVKEDNNEEINEIINDITKEEAPSISGGFKNTEYKNNLRDVIQKDGTIVKMLKQVIEENKIKKSQGYKALEKEIQETYTFYDTMKKEKPNMAHAFVGAYSMAQQVSSDPKYKDKNISFDVNSNIFDNGYNITLKEIINTESKLIPVFKNGEIQLGRLGSQSFQYSTTSGYGKVLSTLLDYAKVKHDSDMIQVITKGLNGGIVFDGDVWASIKKSQKELTFQQVDKNSEKKIFEIFDENGNKIGLYFKEMPNSASDLDSKLINDKTAIDQSKNEDGEFNETFGIEKDINKEFNFQNHIAELIQDFALIKPNESTNNILNRIGNVFGKEIRLYDLTQLPEYLGKEKEFIQIKKDILELEKELKKQGIDISVVNKEVENNKTFQKLKEKRSREKSIEDEIHGLNGIIETMNINGFEKDGIIYINYYSKNGIYFIFGHELVHSLKKENPEAYQQLLDSFKGRIKTKYDDYKKELPKEFYKTNDDVVEEILGDIVGDIFNSSFKSVVPYSWYKDKKQNIFTNKLENIFNNFAQILYKLFSKSKQSAEFRKNKEVLEKYVPEFIREKMMSNHGYKFTNSVRYASFSIRSKNATEKAAVQAEEQMKNIELYENTIKQYDQFLSMSNLAEKEIEQLVKAKLDAQVKVDPAEKILAMKNVMSLYMNYFGSPSQILEKMGKKATPEIAQALNRMFDDGIRTRDFIDNLRVTWLKVLQNVYDRVPQNQKPVFEAIRRIADRQGLHVAQAIRVPVGTKEEIDVRTGEIKQATSYEYVVLENVLSRNPSMFETFYDISEAKLRLAEAQTMFENARMFSEITTGNEIEKKTERHYIIAWDGQDRVFKDSKSAKLKADELAKQTLQTMGVPENIIKSYNEIVGWYDNVYNMVEAMHRGMGMNTPNKIYGYMPHHFDNWVFKATVKKNGQDVSHAVSFPAYSDALNYAKKFLVANPDATINVVGRKDYVAHQNFKIGNTIDSMFTQEDYNNLSKINEEFGGKQAEEFLKQITEPNLVFDSKVSKIVSAAMNSKAYKEKGGLTPEQWIKAFKSSKEEKEDGSTKTISHNLSSKDTAKQHLASVLNGLKGKAETKNQIITGEELMKKYFSNSGGKNRFVTYLQSRKNIQGFSLDMERVDRQYMLGMSRYLGMQPYRRRATQLYEKIFHQKFDLEPTTDFARWMKRWLNDVNGNPSGAEKMLNEWIEKMPFLKNYIGKRYGNRWSLEMTQSLTEFNMITKMGWNVSSAFIQLSNLLNVYAKLGARWTSVGIGKVAKGLSPKDKAIIDEMYLQNQYGLETDAAYNKLHKMNLGHNSLVNFARKGLGLVYLTDRKVREMSGLAGYYASYAKNSQLPEKERHLTAIADGKKFAMMTNFDSSVWDSPGIMRYGGPISKILLQFKTYGLKEMEFVFGHLRGMEQVRFWIPFLLLAGFAGIPMGEWANSVVKGISGGRIDLMAETKNYILKLMKEKVIPDAVGRQLMYGILGSSKDFGVDISYRIGMYDFFPSSISSMLGPTANSLWTLKDLLIAQPIDNLSGANALRAIVPGLGGAILGIQGESTNPRDRNRTEIKYTDIESVWRTLGFMPVRESEVRTIDRILTYEKQERKLATSDAIDRYIANPTSENAKKLAELGITRKQVADEMKKKALDREERTVKGVPKKQRNDYKHLTNPGGESE